MKAIILLARKELVAQSMLAAAIVAAVLAGELPRGQVTAMQAIVYVLGALALGATSMGHEYRHGTLAQLLVQPIRRWTILAVKLGVLAALLPLLAGVAALVVVPNFHWHGPYHDQLVALLVLPPLYGLVVAPWLTLMTRNTLAGTLFSGALGAILVLGGEWVGARWFHSRAEIEAFGLTVLWTGSAVLLVGAGAALTRSFGRLEVHDHRQAHVTLPGIRRAMPAGSAARRHPLLLLAGKELHLQHLTLIASSIYVVVYLALWTRRASFAHTEDAVGVATAIHALVVAALAGALSCAEERALGTLEWQLLQPISMRMQFATKVAVTTTLTLLLAIGLPAVLWQAMGQGGDIAIGGPDRIAFVIVLLLAGSMYLSSVVSNAFVAFFACVPAFMTGWWFLQNVAERVGRWTFVAFHPLPDGRFTQTYRAGVPLEISMVFGLVLLGLYFVFENHRMSDRPPGRAFAQVVTMALVVIAIFAGFGAAGRLL